GYRGEAPERGAADDRGGCRRLHAQGVVLAGHVRAGLLRHRDDDGRRTALRPGPVRHGGLPGVAAAGGPDDRRRPRQPEDGARAPADLRPDGRAQVGARDGCLRLVGRDVQQLRDRAGRRPRRARRHVPPRLPAAAGDAHRRDPQAPRPGPGRQARSEPPRPDPGARDRGAQRAADLRHARDAAM
ncbi:MAG: NADH-ubiquinone oxidoreductase chain B, partial [uncultured Nocardioidaceae bacterium]